VTFGPESHDRCQVLAPATEGPRKVIKPLQGSHWHPPL